MLNLPSGSTTACKTSETPAKPYRPTNPAAEVVLPVELPEVLEQADKDGTMEEFVNQLIQCLSDHLASITPYPSKAQYSIYAQLIVDRWCFFKKLYIKDPVVIHYLATVQNYLTNFCFY